MNDRQLLIWIHAELTRLGTSPLNGMMHHLRDIIYNTPQGFTSPHVKAMNDLRDLQNALHDDIDLEFPRND